MGERVVVTGVQGRLGSVVLADLLAAGHEVVGVDRRSGERGGIRVVGADIGDVGQVAGAARGASGIIHLAAIAAPYSDPDEVVFRNNSLGTFAVLQAAALLGIRRVVIASSVSAYGGAWSPVPFPPQYVPMDESHPMSNRDVYGHSKEVDELTARMFVRREGMGVAALRFGAILPRDRVADDRASRQVPETREAAIRAAWAGSVVDVDAARACRLALDAAGARDFGFEAFNIVAEGPLDDPGTAAALGELIPELQFRERPESARGAYDCGKAERMLGWSGSR